MEAARHSFEMSQTLAGRGATVSFTDERTVQTGKRGLRLVAENLS